MKKKALSKGYTLEVVSWENDGDHYYTGTKTFDSMEDAVAIRELFNSVFVSHSNGGGGIGNMYDYILEEAEKIILGYCKRVPMVVDALTNLYGNKNHTASDEDIVSYVYEINFALMGSTEFYCSRVCESAIVYYSPSDVILDIVE